jgi:hypothetical protein
MAAQTHRKPQWRPAPPPRDEMRAAGKEQNPLVANGRRDLMRDMGRHMPPRLGCVRNATQVQGSRRNLNLVYKQVNENTFLSQTLRPIRRRNK